MMAEIEKVFRRLTNDHGLLGTLDEALSLDISDLTSSYELFDPYDWQEMILKAIIYVL
jgi:hypothetical protein